MDIVHPSASADQQYCFPGISISVHRLERKGRGVFAERRFSKGEVIEKCPVLVIPAKELDRIYETVLSNYIYPWWSREGEEAVVPLGFGCLYNHSYSPNADWVQNLDESAMCYIAVRDIEAGEEITVNYNGACDDRSPLWFEVSD